MSEFKEIKTQEEFDAAIKDRLEREREKYSDYESLKSKASSYEAEISKLKEANQGFKDKEAGYNTKIAELNSKIKGYESDSVKTRIALEQGLPYEMASRLNGEDEDSIRKDAETISRLLKLGKPTPPIHTDENEKYDSKKAGFKKLLSNLENN